MRWVGDQVLIVQRSRQADGADVGTLLLVIGPLARFLAESGIVYVESGGSFEPGAVAFNFLDDDI